MIAAIFLKYRNANCMNWIGLLLFIYRLITSSGIIATVVIWLLIHSVADPDLQGSTSFCWTRIRNISQRNGLGSDPISCSTLIYLINPSEIPDKYDFKGFRNVTLAPAPNDVPVRYNLSLWTLFSRIRIHIKPKSGIQIRSLIAGSATLNSRKRCWAPPWRTHFACTQCECEQHARTQRLSECTQCGM